MRFPCRTFGVVLIALSSLALASCNTTGKLPDRKLEHGEKEFFTSVKPLFETRCVWCHGDDKTHAGLNLQDRAATLNPELKFIVPGDAGASRLYRAVALEAAHPRVMPGDGWGITESQKTALQQWIEKGAPWPEDSSGKIKRREYRVDHDDYR